MLRSLIDAQQGAKFKEWEMPDQPDLWFQTKLADLVDSFRSFCEGLRRLHRTA